jgi:DNA end-binding protein Ku
MALARVMLTNRVHVIAVEARDKGLMGNLLRYPYEVRDAGEYFDDIQDVKITKDMLDLAKHIVEQKSGHFEPEKFEDYYETALQELLVQKQKGQPITSTRKPAPSNVYSLMDALKQSLKSGEKPALRAHKKWPRKQRQNHVARPLMSKTRASCDDTGWVCENHPDSDAGDRDCNCDGAWMPCLHGNC